jgi:hypothetical protein
MYMTFNVAADHRSWSSSLLKAQRLTCQRGWSQKRQQLSTSWGQQSQVSALKQYVTLRYVLQYKTVHYIALHYITCMLNSGW